MIITKKPVGHALAMKNFHKNLTYEKFYVILQDGKHYRIDMVCKLNFSTIIWRVPNIIRRCDNVRNY